MKSSKTLNDSNSNLGKKQTTGGLDGSQAKARVRIGQNPHGSAKAAQNYWNSVGQNDKGKVLTLFSINVAKVGKCDIALTFGLLGCRTMHKWSGQV